MPLAALPRFLNELPGIVDAVAPGAQTILWGHLGDGNVHVNILGAERDDEHVDDAVLRLVLACGGTISAEHGIGIAKARWLLDARGRDDVRAMRAVKAALDPPGRWRLDAVARDRDRDLERSRSRHGRSARARSGLDHH